MSLEQVTTDVVVVGIGPKTYAFPIESVREVLPLVEPTPMPDWPEEALGVIDVRGELVPLVDVCLLLGHQPAKLSSRHLIVLLDTAGSHAGPTWGIVVDRVEGVRSVAVRQTGQMSGGSPLTLGVVSEGGFTVVVLDTKAILAAFHLPGQEPN